MRVLLRSAAALLIAVPVLIVLVIVFVLAGRRGAALPLESGISHPFGRGAALGPSPPAREMVGRVSR
jgi:hypothetical protein